MTFEVRVECGKVDAAMGREIRSELKNAFREKVETAGIVFVQCMVVRDRDLDHSLIELAIRTSGFKPNLLPCIVAIEKILCIEFTDAFQEAFIHIIHETKNTTAALKKQRFRIERPDPGSKSSGSGAFSAVVLPSHGAYISSLAAVIPSPLLMLTLPFSVLPGSNRLFLDYLERVPSALNYYLGHFSDILAFDTHIQFLQLRSYRRQELADILLDQNTKLLSGPKTVENLKLFTESRTFAVVTGQQVGLLTGPLYTVYKALTARKLCAWLEDQFPAHRFVPIFWLESEDHDLDEAGATGFIDKENDYRVVRYREEASPDLKNLQPVGGMLLGDDLAPYLDSVAAMLPETEFTKRILDTLYASYHPANTFAQAFAQYFNALLPDSGLIFVDPSDPRIKRLLVPMIVHELDTAPAAGEEVIKRSAELEERYHAQIKPRAINLFYSSNGSRYPIEPGEHGLFLKGTRKHLSKDELIETAHRSPETFSPNVLLRPVFQDALFPTIAYVAGPSEIAYFAQLQPVYDHFQVPMPIIFPRASITVVEKKIRKLFNKFQFEYGAIFTDPDDIYREKFLSRDEDGIAREFADMKKLMERVADGLPEFAARVNPNLVDPAKNTAGNLRRALTNFEDRLFQSQREKDTVIRRQLEKMQVYLAPHGKPQERQLTILNYLNRYGGGFLREIDAYCDPFPAEHRLLFLD